MEPGLFGLVTSHLPTVLPLESLTLIVKGSCSGLSSVSNLKAKPRSEPVEVKAWLTVVFPVIWEVVLGIPILSILLPVSGDTVVDPMLP